MEAAIHLVAKIPGDLLRVVCLLALTLVFFIPLFFLKKKETPSIQEVLKNTKMALEIKKLSMELDEKLHPFGDRYKDIELRQEEAQKKLEFVEQYDERPSWEEIAYYQKLRYCVSGSVFFFLITTTATLSAEHEMQTIHDYAALFARDLMVCIASGIAATFVPWGNMIYYFTYGFIIPFIIALIIVIIT